MISRQGDWQGWHDLNVRITVSKTDALTPWLQPHIERTLSENRARFLVRHFVAVNIPLKVCCIRF